MPTPVENRRVQIVTLKVPKCRTTATDRIRTRPITAAYQGERQTRPRGKMEDEGKKVRNNSNSDDSSYAEVTKAGKPPTAAGPQGGDLPANIAPVILTLKDRPHKFIGLDKDEKEELIKGLTAWQGPIHDLRIAPRGDLMIFPSSQQQKKELLDILNIGRFEVKIELTKSEREKRVVIHAVPTELSEEQIIEKLAHAGVTKATRWSRVDKSGRRTPSGTVCLTIEAADLPDEVNLDLQIFKTKLYIPRPNICFNCWKFDHQAASCQNKRRCRECGEEHGEDVDCGEAGKCPTCGDPGHMAGTEQCRIYASRQQTIRMAKENNISIKEAAARLKKPTKTTPIAKKQDTQDEISALREEIAALKKDVSALKARPQAEGDQSHHKDLTELKDKVDRLEAQSEATAEKVDRIDEGLKHFQETILQQIAGFRQLIAPRVMSKQGGTTTTTPGPKPGGPPATLAREAPKQTTIGTTKGVQTPRDGAEKRKSTGPPEMMAQLNSPKKQDQRGNTTPGEPGQPSR
jgi:hypothetical protein